MFVLAALFLACRVVGKAMRLAKWGADDSLVVLGFPTWLIWEGWRDKEPRGVVLDLNKMGIVHSSMNIALEVWMLLLPLTQLYKLNLKMKKKLGVIAMFSMGIL
ncbi:uncharacterized protein ColSpa_10523 [Colletotrichum spaethianum]|uniref:Rhodopsin domain-containing protein n=1 Tax=Colletotrichum spaethianum TaxID=700344 RepID=A0AA37UR95_9PEZI|nr:uncharacterized protein ColSpa_10523 [Colletotrichum spaethianum]GKT50342.1 hypothetical protein ColSpa_10523 [Colletotrichum spaethianum]